MPDGDGYRQRARANVRDSDATLSCRSRPSSPAAAARQCFSPGGAQAVAALAPRYGLAAGAMSVDRRQHHPDPQRRRPACQRSTGHRPFTGRGARCAGGHGGYPARRTAPTGASMNSLGAGVGLRRGTPCCLSASRARRRLQLDTCSPAWARCAMSEADARSRPTLGTTGRGYLRRTSAARCNSLGKQRPAVWLLGSVIHVPSFGNVIPACLTPSDPRAPCPKEVRWARNFPCLPSCLPRLLQPGPLGHSCRRHGISHALCGRGLGPGSLRRR
jgi:hypothetical protein